MTDRWRLYLVIFLSTLVNTAFMGCRVGVPLFAIELKASTMTVGVLMSLFGLLPMLLSVHAGRWIDAVGAGEVGNAASHRQPVEIRRRRDHWAHD